MDKVIHFEIPFDDKKRATGFYERLFGWGLVDVPNMDYVIVRAAKTDKDNMVTEIGAINGGLFPRETKGSGPIVVIGVESIDDKIMEIEAAGGKQTLPKVAIPGGHYARFVDTEGNLIGLVDSLK